MVATSRMIYGVFDIIVYIFFNWFSGFYRVFLVMDSYFWPTLRRDVERFVELQCLPNG